MPTLRVLSAAEQVANHLRDELRRGCQSAPFSMNWELRASGQVPPAVTGFEVAQLLRGLRVHEGAGAAFRCQVVQAAGIFADVEQLELRALVDGAQEEIPVFRIIAG